MLEVSIKKKLGAFHLDVSFAAGEEVMALLGASGCGKSLTLKCIAGIERPDEGRIVLNGRVLFDSARHINLTPQKRRVGYLFQQYALFPNMTVLQNVEAGVRRASRAERRRIAVEKLALMHLEDCAEKRPRQLSGGQQQRAALARILANEPELLLLDEPFSALDSYLKWELELVMADVLAAYGGTALFVSHSRDEVFRLCPSVCVLTAGRSGPKLPVRSLFTAPETLSACLLSGCKNYSRIKKLDKGRFQALDWGVALEGDAPDDARYIGVRAHFLRPDGAVNPIPCRVERVIDNVFSVIVMLSTPGGGEGWSRLRLELDPEAWAALGRPAALTVGIEPPDILFLRGDEP